MFNYLRLFAVINIFTCLKTYIICVQWCNKLVETHGFLNESHLNRSSGFCVFSGTVLKLVKILALSRAFVTPHV